MGCIIRRMGRIEFEEDRLRSSFSDMGVDHFMIDHLREEILPYFQYDQPFLMLADMTRDPVTIIFRPDGTARSQCPYRLESNTEYGDCLTLIYKLLEDESFREWFGELQHQSNLDPSLYLTYGKSPRYFLLDGMRHYWLALVDKGTGVSVVIDPAFSSINTGVGYLPELAFVQRVDQKFEIPRAGVIVHELVKYDRLPNGSYYFGDQGKCGFSVLGMGPNGKIVEIGFARGSSKLEPAIPLARLVDPHGMADIYFVDPVDGLINVRSRQMPNISDIVVLKIFFDIASNFCFRFGHY